MRNCCFDLYDAVCGLENDGGIAIPPPWDPPVVVALGGVAVGVDKSCCNCCIASPCKGILPTDSVVSGISSLPTTVVFPVIVVFPVWMDVISDLILDTMGIGITLKPLTSFTAIRDAISLICKLNC